MMRISLDSPALIAIRTWLAGTAERSGRSGRRKASRVKFSAERLEPRMMLDGTSKTVMIAAPPNLVAASDTGASNTDNVTHDRTPDLKGIVQGRASEVRLRIDGVRVATLPVNNGKWIYAVPAEAALAAGKHKIEARPVDAQGKPGTLSKPLDVVIRTAPPTASTLGLGAQSDSGVGGDGQTTYATPTIRGVAQPGRQVNVSIDGEFVAQVKSDAKTGAWKFTSPQLANGTHEVTAVVENRAGIRSAATSFQVTINGLRTVMLDATGGQSVELTASHLLGQGSQGFVVTHVQRGTLEKWSPTKNAWLTIPTKAMKATDPASLQNVAAIRKILHTDVIRWTPATGDVGMAPVFLICPSDTAGGPTAPTPEASTVPGKVGNARLAQLEGGVGSSITWEDPADGDGCGCGSTRYSIEVTREDGQTLIYNVPQTVHGIPIVEGGLVEQARVWGATKTGAGESVRYDLRSNWEAAGRLAYTVLSGASFTSLQDRARAQLQNSPTAPRFTTSLPLGGSHKNLAYLELNALPDPTEVAQSLSAGTPLIISSESNRLTSSQLAELQANPIFAKSLFPGTVSGDVQPDQVRAHFQGGEMVQFAGTVDPSVRAGATVVVEEAKNLGDGSLGPWFEKGRIPVGADGSYSQNYVVPYGLNTVRVRLEYRSSPANPTAPAPGATASTGTSSTSAPISTPIDLSSNFNAFGITTAGGWQVPNSQGFDRNGNYYNSDYTGPGTSEPIPGTPIKYNGITFPLGPIPTAQTQVGGGGNSPTNNPPNFVQATGQTITVNVDADKSDYLYLAGAASNGNQMSQKITLNFTDGTTETWTQSFHDWASVGPAQSDQQTSPTNPKAPVKAATTANIALSGLQTIDGVALAAGDRVLVKNQTYEQKNGIYIVATGDWPRAKDAEVGGSNYYSLWNATMLVMNGTTNGGLFFWENTDPYSHDDDITFVPVDPPVPAPRPFAGELLLKTEPERINQTGTLVTTPAHIFAYCRNLNGKQLASITLPNNNNVGILSAVVAKAPVLALDEGIASVVLGSTNLTGIDLMALTIKNESNIGVGGGPLTFFMTDQPVAGTGSSTQPPTYTTTQVTVPMGQQVTIACVAPDSTSQMNFYVQKADGTCVGPNCSTYLADWTNGSGSGSDFAANISPSLNSQMTSGQHWTMTIQNSAEGYYGYLDSPSGKGLPSASGSTPAGAQFKLVTQAEMNSQPPWVTALEEAIGILVGVAVVTAATGGVADFFIADAAVEDTAGEVANMTVQGTSSSTTQAITETIATDASNSFAAGEAGGGYTEKFVLDRTYFQRRAALQGFSCPWLIAAVD